MTPAPQIAANTRDGDAATLNSERPSQPAWFGLMAGRTFLGEVGGCCWPVPDKKRAGTGRIFCANPVSHGVFCTYHLGNRPAIGSYVALEAAPVQKPILIKVPHATVMRIIEGACLNASKAHQDWFMDPRLARSIAKRAAGTLMAAMPDTLAAPSAPSVREDVLDVTSPLGRDDTASDQKGPGALTIARAAWRPFHTTVARMATYFRQIDDLPCAKTCEEILSLFDAHTNRLKANKVEVQPAGTRLRAVAVQPRKPRLLPGTYSITRPTLRDVRPA